MKFHDLLHTTDLTTHQRNCILNDAFPQDCTRFLQHWDTAKSFDEFKQLVHNDKALALSQATGELLKDNTNFLIEQVNPDAVFITYSDAGSVRIVAGEASFLIPNGSGDGSTIVSLSNKTFNTHAFTFQTCVYGKFTISTYDCEDALGIDVEGDFMVFSNNGIVILQALTNHMQFNDRANLKSNLQAIQTMFGDNELSADLY